MCETPWLSHYRIFTSCEVQVPWLSPRELLIGGYCARVGPLFISVPGRHLMRGELFVGFSTMLERCSVSYGWHVLDPLWVISIKSTIFYVRGLFLCINLPTFDVALCSCYHIHQIHRWSLARGSLKCFALSPFWNAPTNISWLGWITFMVALLKWARYSLNDSDEPWHMLNKLVVVSFWCLLAKN